MNVIGMMASGMIATLTKSAAKLRNFSTKDFSSRPVLARPLAELL